MALMKQSRSEHCNVMCAIEQKTREIRLTNKKRFDYNPCTFFLLNGLLLLA